MRPDQTELELLEIAIKVECNTKKAFAERIGKSRQAVNDIINKAKNNGGKLKPRFIQELIKMHDIDIFKWKRSPTLDFYSPTETKSMILAESIYPWTDKQMIEHLRVENDALREQLRQCRNNLAAQKKNGHRSA